ncbi:MAG: sulfatase family protein [Phycisphaerae bacterium]
MSEKPRENVIWIFGDQHRAQAQGHMGDPNVHTPNVDCLSEEGVTFTQAVAGCPWCTPFRAALLKSRYVHDMAPETPYAVDPSLPTVAEPFNEAGYDTAYFGKWHLDGPRGDSPARRVIPRQRRGGFATWIGYENNNNPQYTYVHGHRGDKEVQQYRLGGFETDCLADLLIDYIRGKADDGQPFFAVLSVQPPHCPYYTAPEEFARRHNAGNIHLRPNVPNVGDVPERARHNLAGYYALIENIDWNVGRVKEALKETGLIDNTHVLFFSDHGDMHGSHGRWQKSTPWEESIRIPFILSGMRPHTRHAGMMRTDALVNHVDIAPTSLGLCGIEPPDWMMGHDYSAYRDGVTPKRDLPKADEPDSAYLQHCVRKMHPGCMDRSWRGVVTRDGWKYVVSEGFPYLMVNLNDDPYEMNNLALDPACASRRQELQQRLAQWMDAVNDPYPLPEL